MPVDIISDKGKGSSNSYASVEEADALFDTVYGAGEWTGLSEDDKARLLITASMSIDDIPIRFNKKIETQAMKFPIFNTEDPSDDGFIIVKRACLLQAFYLFQNTDALAEAQAGAIQGVKSESLSSISKTVSGYNPLRRWRSDVLRLLSKYANFDMVIRKGQGALTQAPAGWSRLQNR